MLDANFPIIGGKAVNVYQYGGCRMVTMDATTQEGRDAAKAVLDRLASNRPIVTQSEMDACMKRDFGFDMSDIRDALAKKGGR